MKIFLTAHPETAKALRLIQGNPVSSGFDNSTYNSLNAFHFINNIGVVTPVRWAMVPVRAFVPITITNPEQTDTNYLCDALIKNIQSQPLQWHLIILVGKPEDPTIDATMPWPTDRPKVDVGTLTIEHVESEDTSAARDIDFDPLVLPDGMASSDDPLLSARSAPYSESFTRREGEHKEPSAVSSGETGK